MQVPLAAFGRTKGAAALQQNHAAVAGPIESQAALQAGTAGATTPSGAHQTEQQGRAADAALAAQGISSHVTWLL